MRSEKTKLKYAKNHANCFRCFEVKCTGLGWPAADTYATFHLVPHERLIRQTILSHIICKNIEPHNFIFPVVLSQYHHVMDGQTDRRIESL